MLAQYLAKTNESSLKLPITFQFHRPSQMKYFCTFGRLAYLDCCPHTRFHYSLVLLFYPSWIPALTIANSIATIFNLSSSISAEQYFCSAGTCHLVNESCWMPDYSPQPYCSSSFVMAIFVFESIIVSIPLLPMFCCFQVQNLSLLQVCCKFLELAMEYYIRANQMTSLVWCT